MMRITLTWPHPRFHCQRLANRLATLQLSRSRGRRSRLGLVVVLGVLAWASGAEADLNPVDISPAGVSGSRPLIDTDGSGNVIAIWREHDDGSSAIRVAVRPKAGDWSTERISATGSGTESPALAIDRRGNAVVVWQQSKDDGSVVRAAVRPAGGVWSDPEDLSIPGDPAFNADVAVEAGHAIAVWVVLRKRHTLVMSSSRTIDGAWSDPETWPALSATPTLPRLRSMITGARSPFGGGGTAPTASSRLLGNRSKGHGPKRRCYPPLVGPHPDRGS